MTKTRSLIVAALASILLTTPARASDNKSAAAALLPTSKWEIDYGDTKCTLSRKFGVGATSWVMSIVPWPLGGQARLTLVSSDAVRSPAFFPGMLVLGEEGGGERIYVRRYDIRPHTGSMFTTLIDQKSLRMGLASGRALKVQSKFVSLSIAPDQAGKALSALDICQKDLLQRWGMSSAAQTAIVTPSKGNVLTFFKSSDYPRDALSENLGGITRVTFWIGADGKASGCKVVETSGSTSLDATTCAVIDSRAKLTPAIDRSGNPVVSLSFAEVNWVVPGVIEVRRLVD